MTSSALLYSRVSSPQAKDGVELIDRLSPLKGRCVLDLGCGTGYLASVLAQLVGPEGKVTGVDPDEGRIRLAQEEFGSIENLNFVVGNGEEFPCGPYDIVFSNYVMHWIRDKEPVFQKVFQNLCVNGKFALRYVDKPGQLIIQLETLMKPGSLKMNDYNHFCPPDVYEAIAKRCGFQVEFKSVGSETYNFPNIEAFMEWVYATTNGKFDYHSIDATALDTFKKDFGDEPVSYPSMDRTHIFIKA